MDGEPTSEMLPAAPALVFSVSARIGNDPDAPQIAFQSAFDRDAESSEINKGLDGLIDAIERQQMRAEIRRLGRENRRNAEMIANDDRAIERAEATYQAERKRITEEAANLAEAIPGITTKAEAEWARSGRQGPFKPSNSVTTAIDRANKEVSGKKIDLTNLDLERSRAREDVKRKQQSWRDEIERNNLEIARLTELVG